MQIDLIRTDGGTQPRDQIDMFTVLEYAEELQSGAQFPPVTVFYDGAEYWLADGFHRLRAHEHIQATEIAADVRQGTQRDAVLFSVSANADHGKRRTNADKRRAVLCLLNDAEWQKWSDYEVAKACKVSQPFVLKLRGITNNVISEKKYVTKHGTVSTMNTSSIGKKPSPAPQLFEQLKDTPLRDEPRAADTIIHLPEPARADVVRIASKWSITDPWKLRKMADLHKSAQNPYSNGTLDEIDTTGGFHYGDDLDKWCDFANDSVEQIEAALKSLAKHHAREARNAQIEERKSLVFPEGIFNVIYADPAWEYSNSGLKQSAAQKYITTPTDEICEMPIQLHAADNAVLFLWATSPLLADALQVMTAWGFDYKTSMVWVKNGAPGSGWWVQTYHEILLIGSRGSFLPEYMPKSIVEAPVTQHSRKPDEFYTIIERMYPGAKYLELFARRPRTGWQSFGNEVQYGNS